VEIPFALWDVDQLYDPDNASLGALYTKHGGFIQGVQQFDPRCFRIAQGEARCMDPHQRKALDVGYAAYNQPGVQHQPREVVVSVGQCCNDWMTIPHDLTSFSGTGVASCICANRISFVLGLKGASLVVDTACSSSLVAAEIAFKKLRAGSNPQALV